MLPQIKLDHLIRLTDDTGVTKYACGVPDRRSGYSSDDAARSLVAALMHFNKYGDKRALDLASKYLSFLLGAQMPDGSFHNCMSYNRQFTGDSGSEETFGRAIWGLGVAVAYAPDEKMRALARDMFERGVEAFTPHRPRALAYAICGLSSFLQRYEGALAARRRLATLADGIVERFESNSYGDWRWFDEEMTYANARLPHGLLLAHRATGIERFQQVGLESLDFLLEVTYQDGYFEFVGNQGWYRRGGQRAVFIQQPVEAGYTVEACLAAYEITGLQRYLEMAEAAVEWLLGRNRLSMSLYDLATGACADGLDLYGPSTSQGAESAASAMIALLAITSQGKGGAEPDKPRPSWVEILTTVLGESS
jgi:hypothetical protein